MVVIIKKSKSKSAIVVNARIVQILTAIVANVIKKNRIKTNMVVKIKKSKSKSAIVVNVRIVQIRIVIVASVIKKN